jgi:hypothetical protein
MAMIETAGRVLILKRAAANRPSGDWNDDDFDVLADGEVVGRILKVPAAPVGTPWMWSLPLGNTMIERRRTAMPQRERPQWRRSPRAGGGSEGS